MNPLSFLWLGIDLIKILIDILNIVLLTRFTRHLRRIHFSIRLLNHIVNWFLQFFKIQYFRLVKVIRVFILTVDPFLNNLFIFLRSYKWFGQRLLIFDSQSWRSPLSFLALEFTLILSRWITSHGGLWVSYINWQCTKHLVMVFDSWFFKVLTVLIHFYRLVVFSLYPAHGVLLI